MAPSQFLALGWVLLTIAPAAVPIYSPQAKTLHFYVKTDEGGERKDLEARRESVSDVTAALAAKKKVLTAAEGEAGADVLIEVIERSVYVPKVVMGLNPRPGDPSSIPGMIAPVRSPVLRVRVTRGPVAIVFTNKNKPPESLRGWQEAASDVAGQIEKWLRTK
ncbi:MAG TPA: hypothetical protein VFV78_13680 [Vicinamibacterales bacterium]|nr:hypothetical protein [Vicinamibacterales bacterium]